MTSEVRALSLSAAAALILGVMGVAVSLATGSGAILLDGAFNLSFFLTALVTLRVVRLLRRPDDRDYPFGYLYFEPLINTVKALLILTIALVALIDAGVSLYRGGNEVSAGLAVTYAAFGTAICGLLVLALRRARRRAASPLVEADIENWFVNLAITVAYAGGLLPGAVPAAKRHGGRGTAGRPGARRPRRDPHARGSDRHGATRCCWRCCSGHPRLKSSARSTGLVRSALAGSADPDPLRPRRPARADHLRADARAARRDGRRPHRRSHRRVAPGDRRCSGGPISTSHRRHRLHHRRRVRGAYRRLLDRPTVQLIRNSPIDGVPRPVTLLLPLWCAPNSW